MSASTRTSCRLDLHNSSTHFSAAIQGRCGFTHLPSGRVCHRSPRHAGSCRLAPVADPSRRAAGEAGQP
jgi:hypothetical protein